MSFTVPENAALARARNSNPGAWERFEKAEKARIAARDAEREREAFAVLAKGMVGL